MPPAPPPRRAPVAASRTLILAAALALLALVCLLALCTWKVYRPRAAGTAATTHAPYPAGQDLGQSADPARSVWPAGGVPRAKDESLLLLHNAAYTVGFSARRGSPLWSSVRLFWLPPPDLGLRQGRPGTFEPDDRLPEALRATTREWVRSGGMTAAI